MARDKLYVVLRLLSCLSVCWAIEYDSCLHVYQHGGKNNDTYGLKDQNNISYLVYCSFGTDLGYTFVSYMGSDAADFSQIIPNDINFVLIRILRGSLQTETRIESIRTYPVTVFYSEHSGFQGPSYCDDQCNRFLFVGVAPSSDQWSPKGYRANGKPYLLPVGSPNPRECFVTVYFDNSCAINIASPKHSYEALTGWLDNAKHLQPNEKIPKECFSTSYIASFGYEASANSFNGSQIAIGIPFIRVRSTVNTKQQGLKPLLTPHSSAPKISKLGSLSSTRAPCKKSTTVNLNVKSTNALPTIDTTSDDVTSAATKLYESSSSPQVLSTGHSQHNTALTNKTSSVFTTTESACACDCPESWTLHGTSIRSIVQMKINSTLQAKIDQLKEAISVPAKNTSSQRRKKTCDSRDRRNSSKVMGVVSAILVSLPMLLLCIGDFAKVAVSLFRCLRPHS